MCLYTVFRGFLKSGNPMKCVKILTFVLGLIVVGCGDDESPFELPEMDMENNVNGMADMDSGPTTEPDMEDPFDPDEGCEGLLEIDTNVSPGERAFERIQPFSTPTCEGDEDFDGALVYKVEVSALTELTILADGVPKLEGEEIEIPPQPVVEIREAACFTETTNVVACSAERETTAVLQPDTPYYVVVNGRRDSGGVRLDFSAEELVCEVGPVLCEGSGFSECERGQSLNEFACVDRCLDESSCRSNTCSSATVLSYQVDGAPVTLTGHRRAYTNDWNARNRPNCTLEPGVPAGPTPDADFFVRIPQVRAGHTIHIDARRSEGAALFYFLDSCESAACLASGFEDENGENQASYTAAEDGDVFVVVEAAGSAQRTFEVDVSIEQ